MKNIAGLVLRIVVAGLLFGVVCLAPRVARAATCTVSGSFKVEPRDRFYCDGSHLYNCTGWKEIDLDRARDTDLGARGLQWMYIKVKEGSTTKEETATYNSNGDWSATFTVSGSTCTGHTVTITNYFRRIHEDDRDELEAGSGYRSRLRVSDENGNSYGNVASKALTGPTSSYSYTYQDDNNTTEDKAANFYYTANSFITEAVTWTTNIAAEFAGSPSTFQVRMDVDVPISSPYFDGTGWLVWLDASTDWARGGTVRHEMGHAVHHVIHHRNANSNCGSDAYLGMPAHNHWSCEYGYWGTTEGTAWFVAQRSMVTGAAADQEAWMCDCGNVNSQDVCSDMVDNYLTGAMEWMEVCSDHPSGFGPGTVFAVGDQWIDSTADCTELTAANACSFADVLYDHGFRNEVQVSRFLWDMIDSHNEASQDDTDESMASLMAGFEAVPCTLNGSTGDGECNEAGFQPTCYFDKYNVYDIAAWVPGSQTTERTLNCVEEAPD